MAFGLVDFQGWLWDARTTIEASAEQLDELDAAIGDGDHGTNMARGFDAANQIDFTMHDTPALGLRQVGMQLLGHVGGAAGTLYGTWFLTLGSQWPSQPNTPRVAACMRAARDAVQARGRAEAGDKTMVDPLHAAVQALEAQADDAPFSEAMPAALEAARAARDATRDMVAKRGRAALLGERSLGHVDPGAESVVILMEVATRHLD